MLRYNILIGKKWLGTWGGILAAFFYSFIPYNIYFTRVILPEPLAVFFTISSLWFFVKYIEQTKNKSELERQLEGRKKTGVFTGSFAINQLNGKRMPVWIGDFVLMNFGTGAIVGVPGHDMRDWEFAREFNLEVLRVVWNDMQPSRSYWQ